jgi:hypothetical protein
MALQEISSSEMYGISKRINAELEAFPLHCHSAIVEMVRVGMQCRNLAMQHAAQEAQKEQQEKQLAMQQQMLDHQAKQADRAAIEKIGLVPPN